MLSPRLSIVGTWSDDTKAINAGAAYFFHSEATSQLSIYLKKAHHLEEGDEVRLIGKNGPKEVKVIKMFSDTEFIVANWDKEDLYENGQLYMVYKFIFLKRLPL